MTTRLTVEQEWELTRLLRIDDTLGDVHTLILDRRHPEEVSAESLERMLEVLGELRDEAGAAFVRARREAGIPDPV